MLALSLVGLVILLAFDAATATRIYIITMTFSALMFAVMYAVRANWRKTGPGRALMYVHASFAALGLQIFLSVFLGTDYPGRTVTRLFLYLALTLALVNMNLTLFRVQWWQHNGVSPPPVTPAADPTVEPDSK
jgi:hypothetical protein